jgi:hypothetical protein
MTAANTPLPGSRVVVVEGSTDVLSFALGRVQVKAQAGIVTEAYVEET